LGWANGQTVMGDDASIEARNSLKKKLEYLALIRASTTINAISFEKLYLFKRNPLAKLGS
jgi:hypothetical protein